MRARDIVGKRITRVVQQRIPDDKVAKRPGAMHIHRIELDDGSAISFDAWPMEDEILVRPFFHPAEKPARKRASRGAVTP